MKQWIDEQTGGEREGSITLKYYRYGEEQDVPLF
jgi:hypothetical protein